LPLSHLTEPRVDITPALTGLAQARWPYARARGLASTVQRLVEVALVTRSGDSVVTQVQRVNAASTRKHLS